jgi:hypothetical protein
VRSDRSSPIPPRSFLEDHVLWTLKRAELARARAAAARQRAQSSVHDSTVFWRAAMLHDEAAQMQEDAAKHAEQLAARHRSP